MCIVYNIGIYLYFLAIKTASMLGNSKAKLWVDGRNAQKDIFLENHNSSEWIWVHVSSLGEFEQGRPLIEHYKQKFPDISILLTFFSPSGYEIRKNYKIADLVLYLPLDTPQNAKQLINKFNLKAVFFVKYDFWFNYLRKIKKNNIPLYLISGIFRSNQHFFKWYGKWQRKQLGAFTHFFVQNQKSYDLLRSVGFKNVTIAGDTRFDRVLEVANSAKYFPEIERFIDNKIVYMAGSSWDPDEVFINSLIEKYPDIKFIIIPHEVDKERIDALVKKLPYKASLYTEKELPDFNNSRILIINTIGMLSSLYKYATIAHIGNGFGSGIHNTLEAAVYGVPIIFGPNYHKFQEAHDLLKCGAAFYFTNLDEYIKICDRLLKNKEYYSIVAKSAKLYVSSNVGATKTITDFVNL